MDQQRPEQPERETTDAAWNAPLAQPAPVAIPYARVAVPVYPDSSQTAAQAIIDLIAVGAILVLGDILLYDVTMTLIETLPDQGPYLVNTIIGVLTLAAVGLVLFCRRLPFSSIGLRKTSPDVLILGTILSVVTCFCMMVLIGVLYTMTSSQSFESMMEQKTEFLESVPDPGFATILLFAVFVGFHEELLFRGFALPRLIAIFGSRTVAVLLGSVMFGLLHAYQGPMGIYQTAGIGLVFYITVTKTRSLWPAILAHAIFNGVNISLIPLLRDALPDLMEQAASAPAM